MALCHDNLLNFYKMNFSLMQHHDYNLFDIENMIPFEREVYISLLLAHLKEEQERLKRKKNHG